MRTYLISALDGPLQNIEVQLDRLQRTWIDGLFVAVRESHKQYDKRQAELEEAEAKYLGLKKVGSLRFHHPRDDPDPGDDSDPRDDPDLDYD